MLEKITPLILTYNEAPNIERTLESLHWARDIVVVDSFSEDETPSLLARFPNVRLFQRKFDTHSNQWNFALKDTGIASEWVLALDADHVLTDNVVEELKTLSPESPVAGYSAKFIYCISGKPLRSSLYPPVTVLFRRALGHFVQDGHAQKLVVKGEVKNLSFPLLHDDRKPFSQWLAAQDRYEKLEAKKIFSSKSKELDWPDRVRKMKVIAPFAVFLYCLFFKGLILDGLPGFYYAFQRMIAELLLSLYLIQQEGAKKID